MDDDSLCKICMDSPVSALYYYGFIFFENLLQNNCLADRLRDAGVWSHVHLHQLWQADGRVPHLQAVCRQSCQDFQGLERQTVPVIFTVNLIRPS